MKLPPLEDGTFVRRLNRFVALVEVAGRQVMAHVANSGRMQELLQPGNPCSLVRVERPGRKTLYDLALIQVLVPASGPRSGTGVPPQLSPSTLDPSPGPQGQGTTRAPPGLALLVSTDARLPNQLVWEALLEGRLEPFADYAQIKREVTVGESRLDLALDGASGRCLLEVKSVTLVEDGVGIFPDAPTERGRRHVVTLARALAQENDLRAMPSPSTLDPSPDPQGKDPEHTLRPADRSAVIFIIQREDATALVPNDRTDPAFGAALREAVTQGVEIYAYTCHVTLQEVRIQQQVPVLL